MTFAVTELLSQPLPDVCRSVLTSCLNATESASRMVMNLLDLSSSARLPVNAADCLVSSLFGHLRDRFAARLYMRHVSVLMRATATELWADWDILRRVAENLVDNAIRYAPTGSEVEITVNGCDGGTMLEVLDQGPGVPEAYREQVFDRFVQLDPAASSRAGRGLGLAFCRTAMEAHGGWISVIDGPAGGACFSAFFPGPLQEGSC